MNACNKIGLIDHLNFGENLFKRHFSFIHFEYNFLENS